MFRHDGFAWINGRLCMAKELDLSASEKVSYRAISSAFAREQGHLQGAC